MKKSIVFMLIMTITLNCVCFSKSSITPPLWSDILPQEAKYSYKEPIQRPKWAYPAAWVACIGTLGLAQIPYIMRNKDDAISENNYQYQKYEKIKQQFDTDIKNCGITYKSDKELLGCYMDVKQHYQLLLNQVLTRDAEETRNDLLREQNRLIQIQNSRINSQPYQTKHTQLKDDL